MPFPGWTKEDSRIFEVPDFSARMELIRTVIRPKLKALALALEPHLGRTPFEWHAHIASHLRRRTNPPNETWAAFGRNKKGYKMYAHLMTGISIDGAFARLIVKSDALDYANLKSRANNKEEIEKAIFTAQSEATEAGYRISYFDGIIWKEPTAEEISNIWFVGESDFVIGRQFSISESADGHTLVRKISDTFEALMPFYQIGSGL